MSVTYRKLPDIILSLLLIGVIALITYTFNKGFDFTDEGNYLLLSNPHQPISHSLYNYDVIFKILYNSLGIELNIVGLRLVRLVGTLGGSIMLGLAIIRLNRKGILVLPLSKLNIILLVIFFSFSSYTLYAQSLSYNTLILIFSLIAISCLLFTETSKSKINYLYYFIIGLCVLGLWVCKPPSAVFVSGIIVIYTLWRGFYRKEIKQGILYVLVFILSLVIADVILARFYPRTWFISLAKNILEFSKIDKTHNGILLFLSFFQQTALLFESFVLGWIASFLYFQYRLKYLQYAIVGAGLLVLLIITQWYTPATHSLFIPLGVFYLLGYDAFRAGKFAREDMTHRTVLILVMLGMPLACTIGTNTLVINNLTVHSTFFFTALFFLPESSIFKPGRQVIIVAGLTVIVLLNLILYPYRQQPLAAQKYPVSYKNKTHYVDKESKQYIDEVIAVYDSLHILPAERYGFNMFEVPGDVAIVDAIYPQNVVFEKEKLPLFSKYFMSKNQEPDNLLIMLREDFKVDDLNDFRAVYDVQYIKEVVHPYENKLVKIFYLHKRP